MSELSTVYPIKNGEIFKKTSLKMLSGSLVILPKQILKSHKLCKNICFYDIFDEFENCSGLLKCMAARGGHL